MSGDCELVVVICVARIAATTRRMNALSLIVVWETSRIIAVTPL
jgi:hypothetical protein